MDVVVALFRLAVATFALVGTKEIWLQGSGDDLVYFTNQAGLMLAVVMIWAAFASLGAAGVLPARLRIAQPPAWFKGAVTLFLVITGLVAYFVLAPEDPNKPATFLGLTSGQIEHQITPIATLVDFLLLDAHRRLRWRIPALWLTYLIAYATFTTIRGEILATPDYPYPFVDLADLGWGGLLMNVAIYGVGFYVLGCVLVGIDHRMPARALLGSAGAAEGSADDDAGPATEGTTPPMAQPPARK